mgnify:CR=1 FL=1|jgi:CRP-like cAMP-binding protein
MNSLLGDNNYSNSLFKNLSPDSQAKIINVSHRVHYDYKKEQTFFLGKGQILLLESGYLMTIRCNAQGKKAGIDILKRGDLLGICLLLNYNYENIISILPLSPVNGYAISLENMNQLIKENHDISLAVISQFSYRFLRVINHLHVNMLGSSKDKLKYALQVINDLEIQQPTHEELAIYSGLNRVTVTKILNATLADMHDK